MKQRESAPKPVGPEWDSGLQTQRRQLNLAIRIFLLMDGQVSNLPVPSYESGAGFRYVPAMGELLSF